MCRHYEGGWLDKCAGVVAWPGEALPWAGRHEARPNEASGARTGLGRNRGCSVMLQRRRKRRARGWLAPQDAVKEGAAHGLKVFAAGLTREK